MSKRRTTKRALLSSVVSLILCFSMLLGSTFAWFTDSVSSVNNIIKSGNLDVNLYYWDNSMETGTSVAIEDESDLTLFRNVDGEEILWEPGATGFGQFEVVNEGSLALKYQLMINYANATKTPEGKTLADVLSVYALARGYETGDDDVMGDENLNQFVNNLDSPIPGFEAQGLRDFTLEGYLLPGESFKYELGAFWEPSDKDNEYNVKGGLSMDFGVTLVATQMTYEKDSYDDQYDDLAEYPEAPVMADKWDGTTDTTWYNTTDKVFTLSTAEQLSGLSTLSASGNTFSGKTIVLDADMNLDGKQWTPIKSFAGTFDGGEHTVSNFTLDGTSGRAGFIQNLGQYPATVKNLTLSDVNGIAASNQYFGILAANGHTSVLENVHVIDSKITTTNKDAWVGGIYGYFNWTSATNCTVENLEIDATKGGKFVGGFSGNMDQDLTINNVDIIGLKIVVDATNGASQVGGFTGQTQTGHRQPTFTNCDVIGLDIVAKGEVQLGGFIGDAGAHTIANNCTVEGKIDASGVTDNRSFIGGFMADSGWNNNESSKGGHKLTNCSADVDIITGGSTAGGFIGSTTAYHSDGGNRNMPITMTNCTATGTVSVADASSATIGGFAGEAERGTFKNCSTTSDTFIGKVWDGYTLNDDGNGTLTVKKQ